MSKKAYISRYLLIIKRLKAKPYSSYDDLRIFMDREVEFLQMQDDSLSIGFSKRTLQRDLSEIRNLFGIDIEYSRNQRGYYILDSDWDNMNFQRMMEAFDLFNSLNLTQDFKENIILEKRRPQGTENLYGLLHAIKNKLLIRFSYQKFWEDEKSLRLVEPYALKEFNNRWYIIVKDLRDKQTKSFALDRLSDLEITKEKFIKPKDLDIEGIYRFCFGIVNPNGLEPEDIILSFEPHQGKYIKTLPLHRTQEVILEDEKELQISLKICLTQDFIMELLSFGSKIKVLHPEILVTKMKNVYFQALKQYQDE